ncbi:thioesterase domain-containing protein [Actinoplanes sp. NPDC049118]|uniref:thioesterase II family protein n=1 Tax=Actinoplanes sp. NPDC049118 TaxID=3155769 RepID=UPI0033FA613E
MPEASPDDVEILLAMPSGRRSSFRLVCFPHTLETTASYLALADLLLPTVEVLAIRYPGVSTGPQRRIPDTEDLVDRCCAALSQWTDRPLAVLGHRAGAYLAYRVAGRLAAEAGAHISVLFAVDRAGPPRTAGEPMLSERVVAVLSDRDAAAATAAAGWAACTTGTVDVERVADAQRYLHGDQRALANLIHDELLAAPVAGAPGQEQGR